MKYYSLQDSEYGKQENEYYFALDSKHPYRMPDSYIEDKLSIYDCIVARSEMTENESVENYLKARGDWEEWCYYYDLIVSRYPEYESACRFYLSHNYIIPSHMMLASKEVYDDYLTWLEDLFMECTSQKMCPHLLRIWLLNQGIKVREELIKEKKTDGADDKIREIELKKRYVKTILSGLITNLQNGQNQDVVDCSPLPVDFHGKIPVWICWWQGIENAPEIVKKCVGQMKKTVTDEFEIYLITMENVGEYITLPEWIIEKFGRGKISLTHLSDVLRFGLLYRYGGLWIDATYWVLPSFWKQIRMYDDFFVCKLKRSKWTYDVSEGRWASNVFFGRAGNFLYKFMVNAYYEYWRMEEELIDYYQLDYMIAVAYDCFPRVKQMIDRIPATNPEILTLFDILEMPFSQKRWEELTEETNLFKLTYKREFMKETIVGKANFYAKIVLSA